MAVEYFEKAVTATSPASATTAAATESFKNLPRFDWLVIDADLQGATGGTLDVYLQRKAPGTDQWYDYAHYAQLTAGGAAVSYTIQPLAIQGITTVGKGTSPALVAGTCTGGHPGEEMRILFTAGAGTSAGAAQTIRLSGIIGRD
jgi:hypothetical protein